MEYYASVQKMHADRVYQTRPEALICIGIIAIRREHGCRYVMWDISQDFGLYYNISHSCSVFVENMHADMLCGTHPKALIFIGILVIRKEHVCRYSMWDTPQGLDLYWNIRHW